MAGYNAAERYKEKKKNNTDTSTPYNAAERYKQHKQYENTDTNSVDKNYINSFLTDASNFLGNAKVEENSYNSWQDLNSRANTIKAWTWKKRDNLEKESYKLLNDSLSAFDSAAEYWNQFKTPEEYNKFWKEYSSYYNKWGKYADAEDYAQNSKYVSTRTDVDINDAFNFFSGMYNTSQLFGDFNYDYINRNPDAGVVASSNNAKTGATALGISNNFIEEMTDNEIGIYNYLYATQSPEAAKEFLKDIESDLTRRQRAKSEEYFKNYAKESPIGSSIFSILTSPLKGLSYVGQTADYFKDGKIDQNAGYNKFSYSNSAIRNEVSKNMSGAGNFLYNTGMSIGDFLYATAITGGFTAPSGSTAAKVASAASMAIMGTGAAADTVIASKDMGLSDNQAWILGTAAGAIEAATEKIGIDAMLDKKFLGESIGKYILKNVLAEGMEEGLSNIGNTVVELIDLAFSGDESKIKREIAMIMQEQGISESEAVGKYISGWFKEFGLDVLGGALSGGAVGGGGVAIHTAFKKATTVAEKNKQATQLYGDSTADLISEALDLNPNNKYAQKMQNKLESGKKLSGGQINRLIDENEAIIRNSAISEETSDDSQANTTDTDSVEIPSPTPQNTAQQAEITTTTENSTAEENATESEFKASEDVSENETVDNADTLEEASKKYGAQAQAMIHTYNKGQDIYKFDSAYKTAYDMGKSGVSLSYAKNSTSTAYLTESQKELAYEAGKAAADTTAQEQDAKNKSLANGKIGRKKGTVKGEGVTISDLKKTFNDTLNKAFKILSTYAEVTGIDIVLYKSETDEDGNFIGAQGKFKWKENTIYIDINAGLTNIKDINDLAKYTMLRTFSHEFTHFIEKWNPIWYNEFRKVVFDTLTERGENVHDLIETKMSTSEEMTYDEASREVVAEAMTDILPDANFVETLAANHKNIFDKLFDKLKEFLTDLKEYFKAIGDYSSREAKALKNEIDGAVHYVDNIVKLFDKVALEAVENYQMTVAIEEKTEKIDSIVTNNSENISKSAEKVQKNEEVTPVKEDIAENATTTKEAAPESDKTVDTVGDSFTITDNAEFGTLEIKFDGKPSEDIRNMLKEYKFRWHSKKGVWYGKGERANIVKALREAYQSEGIIEAKETTPIVAEEAATIKNTTDIEEVNQNVEIENADNERPILEPDTDTVQEQSRNYLDEDNTNSYSKSRKIPPVDEFSTYAMQWAYSDKTNIGEQKLFYRKGKWVLLEKSADGFVEMGAYAAENYDFIQKEIIKHNEKLHDSGINERVYRSALRYESLGSDNSRNIRNDVGQQTGNGRIGGLYQAESVSNRSADNEKSKSNNEDLLSRSDSYEQNQQRTNTLTDREVLEIAAEDLMNEKIKVNGEMVDALSQAEKDALTIFQNRLSKLKDLQAERAEQGRLYKEQQFGEKGDKEKATETLNRMHILDDQIKKATADVLTVEEKEVLKRVLTKARKVVEVQERQHGQEILKRWRDRRDNAADIKKYKDRILADREELIKWLKHPLDKNVTKHVNDNVKDAVINFLLSIDTASARKLRKGIKTKEDLKHDREAQDLLMILNNLDDEVRYSGDYDLPLNFTSRLENHIKTVRKLTNGYNGNMVLNRMSVEELRDLSIIIANLKNALTTMNKFHANAMFAHVTEAGNNTVRYLKDLRDSNGNRFENFVMWKNIRPAEVWKRFGKGGISIERALRKGQDKLGLNAKVIIDFAKDTFTAKERKSWDTSAVNVTLSDGRNIKLTVSALMSFYELSKRKQGREHILNGGVTVADVEIRENKKKPRINGRYGRFTEADIDIMNSKLTDKQKEVADKLQQFMEKQGGEWGNYVTLARFGEKPFGEVGYFPISVDKLSLSTQNNDKDIKGADLYRLLNMGFTKELSPNTKQPLMLYSIFDVFSTHMADMAQYNAMALPVLDAIRWLNYKTFDSDTKAETSNLRAELNRAYGSPIEGKGYAENFIVHILQAYNSTEAHSTPEDALGIKFMHNYNRAQVAFNLRVVVQQPISITRAALVINPKYITKALNAKKLKANIEDMLEHSGIAVWKDLGYYDINISRGLTQMIKQDKTHLDKITDLGLKPAEFMDKATWGVIWYACKLQLADQGITDYKQIEELFDEVIYRTQVVDSVLTKSQYMRDKGFFARASSAFMSESVTVASSVLSAYDDFQTEIRKGSSIGKAFGAHKKAIVKTMLVCSVSAIMLSVVQAVADAFRDDDDYEKLYEKFLEAFKSNLIDEFSPLNKLPLIKYIEDIIEVGLDIFTDLDVYGKLSESAIAQWFDTLTKALEITNERLDGNSNYTPYAMIYKYFQVLSGISGIPASAAMREVVTIWNNTFALLYPEFKVTTYEPSDMSQIRYAYEDGYLTADEAVKEMFSLTSKGYSEENIRSQAKSQIGEWYSNDEISKQQTVNMLDRYFDMESDEIDANISYWDFKNDNPDIDVNIGWFEKYYSDIADSGISIDEYVDYRNKVKDISGEDKKSKRMKIINSLPISKSQKDALYLAEGWSESKLYEAPWH